MLSSSNRTTFDTTAVGLIGSGRFFVLGGEAGVTGITEKTEKTGDTEGNGNDIE